MASTKPPNQDGVNRLVRATVLHVVAPLMVNGKVISTPDEMDPGWKLGMPAPIGMDDQRLHLLVIHLNLLVKSLKPKASFSPSDIKAGDDIAALQTTVWGKVKPASRAP